MVGVHRSVTAEKSCCFFYAEEEQQQAVEAVNSLQTGKLQQLYLCKISMLVRKLDCNVS